MTESASRNILKNCVKQKNETAAVNGEKSNTNYEGASE